MCRNAAPPCRPNAPAGLCPASLLKHRLRKRYRQLLRDEIAQTLADADEVDEEMRALFGAFSEQDREPSRMAG